MTKNLKNKNGISTRHNPSVRVKDSTAGITLIALVITIIVLILLAGIAISMLSGENGILQQMVKAKEAQELAKIKEEAELVKDEAIIEYSAERKKIRTIRFSR